MRAVDGWHRHIFAVTQHDIEMTVSRQCMSSVWAFSQRYALRRGIDWMNWLNIEWHTSCWKLNTDRAVWGKVVFNLVKNRVSKHIHTTSTGHHGVLTADPYLSGDEVSRWGGYVRRGAGGTVAHSALVCWGCTSTVELRRDAEHRVPRETLTRKGNKRE